MLRCISLIFTLTFLITPSLFGGDITNADIQQRTDKVNEIGDHRIQFTAPSSIPSDGIIRITYPFGYDISQANLGSFSGTLDGTFNLTVDEENRNVIIERNGNGSPSPADSTIEFNLKFIQNPSHVGLTGVFGIATTQLSGSIIDEGTAAANNMTATFFDRLTSLSRRGGLIPVNQIFELRIAVTDEFGNISDNNNSTIIDLVLASGTGQLSFSSAQVSSGIATFLVSYNQEEKITLRAEALIRGNMVSADLGHFYVVSDVEGPSSPSLANVIETGNSPQGFEINWKASLTPNVKYEIWEPYSNFSVPLQKLPYSDYGLYSAYLEFAQGTPYNAYHRYFSTFSRDYYMNYSQWNLIDVTNQTSFTFPPIYSSFFPNPYINYSEFNDRDAPFYGSYFEYGKFYANDWFLRTYGAFRIVAVDSQGKRSLSSTEILRYPINQSGVTKSQNQLLPPPENVVVYKNSFGAPELQWEVTDNSQINKFHVYRKIVVDKPGVLHEYAAYSQFSFLGESLTTSFLLNDLTLFAYFSYPNYGQYFQYNIYSNYATYHEYSSFNKFSPFGIYKVVSAGADGSLSASSSESRNALSYQEYSEYSSFREN